MSNPIIDWVSLSNSHSILAACPTSLRESIYIQSFTRGEQLFCRGEQPTAMLCVVAGEVRLVRPSAGGSEIILQRVHKGFVAEASLEVARYHCDIVAAADGALLHFPIAEFRSALAKDSVFQSSWISHLAREVRKLRAQCERLSLKSAAERVVHYIETEGNGGTLTLSQSRKAWAAELGLSHETLYRTLRDMTNKQVLLIDAAVITLTRTP